MTVVGIAILGALGPCAAWGQRRLPPGIYPEVRSIPYRDPSPLPPSGRDPGVPPATVERPQVQQGERLFSLDACLQTTLLNMDVVRLLSNFGSARAAVTIYDPAIATAAIDQAQAAFDPQLRIDQQFRRFESPSAVADPGDPLRSLIVGSRTDDYDLFLDLSKKTSLGGVARLIARATPQRFQPGTFPLNPQSRSSAELQYTQPLLQGGGTAVNQVQIVLARIDTQRSFFQLKDAVQESVRGVINAYWDLAAARVDVLARQKQVEQAAEAVRYTQARKESGFGDAGDLAQARLALANFKASLIVAQANLLDREAALRAIMNLPPPGDFRLVPSTHPVDTPISFHWERLVEIAENRRPDIVELKLVIEADRQLLIQSRNQALPRLDAVALYRWNGLEGTMPVGTRLRTANGQYTDWTIAVNFSVPLGLRQERAGLRRQELILIKDQAFLQQGLHNMTQSLAGQLRRISSAYAQYVAFQETRKAARENLLIQRAEYLAGRTILLNVLQAIADFGNAVSSEARALATYNIELANLERESGTILESHGIRFFEETERMLGPLGRLGHGRLYPHSLHPSEPQPRFGESSEPWDRELGRLYELQPGEAPEEVRPR